MNRQDVWKPVPGFDGYFARRDGTIGSEWIPTKKGAKKTGIIRELKQTVRKSDGYCHVTLAKDGEHFDQYAHQVIAITFIGPCPVGLEVCHRNGIKSKNRVSNLRYGTSRSNHS